MCSVLKFFIFFIFFSHILMAASFLKTGQVLSYNANGNLITDGSIKDDGYYKKGLSRSYSRDGDIVIDNITGLQWQDNESITRPWLTQKNYDDGNYNDTTGMTASTYCSELSYQGSDDWRLPSIDELKTIIDFGEYPAVTENIFHHISLDVYFSSSSTGSSSDAAWTIDFEDGVSHYASKKSSFSVRCVKEASLESSSFSRSTDGVVTDARTKLQWQDNAEVKTVERSWEGALEYCESLTLSGKKDWRLPNNNELYSIIDRSRSPAVDTTFFQNAYLGYHWSSTSVATNPPYGWWIHFAGMSTMNLKGTNCHVSCVRGGSATFSPALINYLLD